MKNDYEKIFFTSLLLIFGLMSGLAVISIVKPIPIINKPIEVHWITKHIIYLLLSYTCYSLYWLGVIGVKFYKNTKQIAMSIMVVIAIYIVTSQANQLIQFMASTFGLLIPAVIQKKKTIKGYILFLLFGFLYAATRKWNISPIDTNKNEVIYTTIDLIIFLATYYMYRINGGNKKWLTGLNLFSEIKREFLSVKEKKNKIRLEKQRIESNLSTRLLMELKMQQVVTLGLFSYITIGFAVANNKLIEYIAMFVSYYILRTTFKKEFHTDPGKCVIISMCVFLFAITNTFQFEISLISGVAIAFAIDFATCHLQNYLDLLKQSKKKFDIKTCTKEELENRCIAAGIRGAEKELCIDIFTSGLKLQDIAEKHGFERGTVANRKTKYKKKLTNDISFIEQPS